MRTLWAKLKALFKRPPFDDLSREIEAHLALEIEDRIAAGLSPDAARHAAQVHFGNRTLVAEKARDAWTFPRLESFLQDSRYALRALRRAPAFSATVILTLALGIGPTTAIFSVVDTVLLRPLPYPNGERLVRLQESTAKVSGFSVAWLNYNHWRDENHSLEGLAAYQFAHHTLTGRGEPLLTRAAVVTANLFPLTGGRPLLGRLFTANDDRAGAPPVAVVSYNFWINRLGADPQALSTTLNLDGSSYQIVGVLQPKPSYFETTVDLYLPLAPTQAAVSKRSQHGSIQVLGLLKPGLSLAAARTDIDHLMQQLALSDPGPESEHRVAASFLSDNRGGQIRPALFPLLAAVFLVLLIASANVASLLLARGATRARELALRAAIGAGGSRILRQLFTEQLILSGIGGFLGLLLAHWSLLPLTALGPRVLPRLAEVRLDARVLAFSSLLTLLTALFVTLASALSTRRLDLTVALKDDSRALTGSRSSHTLRGALVVGEIALTLVLCIASGLLLRSLAAAQNTYPGFAADHLSALELVLPASTYPTPASTQTFYTNLIRDLAAVPSVTDVGAVLCPPGFGDCGDWFYSIPSKPQPAQGDVPIALTNLAGPGYFHTMRMQLIAGRAFRDSDRAGAPPVAIVNEQLARSSPVGQHIKLGGPYMPGPLLEVVGVVRNVSQMGLDTDPLPEIYTPFAQSPSRAMVLMIRSKVDPAALAPAIRARVYQADRNLAIQRLRPLEQVLAATLDRRRFSTFLLSTFAALAILLAAIGIYGLLNYWVRVRESDIAIRMALGARPAAIVRWVAVQALRLTATGIVLGLAGAWAASRTIESMVYGIEARNALTWLAAALTIVVIALAACLVPAWRAARVDPIEKLHHS